MLLILEAIGSNDGPGYRRKFRQGGGIVKLETVMSEFASEAELERWIVEVVRERWGIDKKLRTELTRAWSSRLESIRLGYEKDYIVVVDVKAYLRRQGPKRAGRLAREADRQAEEHRRIRQQRLREEGGGDG